MFWNIRGCPNQLGHHAYVIHSSWGLCNFVEQSFYHPGGNTYCKAAKIKGSGLFYVAIGNFFTIHSSWGEWNYSRPTDSIATIVASFLKSLEISLPYPPNRLVNHLIPLEVGTIAVNVKPYRYGHFQKDKIEKLVGKMPAAGIIRPSSSPFSSLVLLVRKKDGSWRFCVDYKALNKAIIPHKYPIQARSLKCWMNSMVRDSFPTWI